MLINVNEYKNVIEYVLIFFFQTLGDYRPNITCESLELIGELMPVEILEKSLEIHSEMLKLVGSYTQHYNAKTRSNAFNTMVILN